MRPAAAATSDGLSERGQVDAAALEEPADADHDPTEPVGRFDGARHATADDGLEVADPPESELVTVRPGDDRGAERVFARALDRAGQVEQARSATPGATMTSATVGRPRVSVPVLSSTTASTRWAISSASPPRIRMPASAPRPVPTMIAVGVARPIAHGQAMTTTPMKAVSASVRRGSGPNTQPHDERARGDDQDERHEHLGDAIGEALDGRLAALRAADELDDAGERRVATDARGAHHERAGRVEGRADDRRCRRSPRPGSARR